MEHDVAIVQM